jgi:hypothetical protein
MNFFLLTIFIALATISTHISAVVLDPIEMNLRDNDQKLQRVAVLNL